MGLINEDEIREWGPEWAEAHPWNGWNAAYLSWIYEKDGEWELASQWMKRAITLAESEDHRTVLMVRQAAQLDRGGKVEEAHEVVKAIDRSKISGGKTPDYFKALLRKHGWE